MRPARKVPTEARPLTRRQLNRALLARQMLLEREKATPLSVIERLVGMQAQIPRPPFGGLWARLRTFEREDLLRLYREKKAVRATAMRGTIHLLSTGDYLMLRPALAGMLAGGASSQVGKRMAGVDVERLYALGRDFFGRTPAPFDDFRKLLETRHPTLDVRALAYTVRMGIPLVMVPSDAAWGFPGNAGFGLAEKWLGTKIPTEAPPLARIVLRYLAAFGPATPADFQAWSALRGVRDTFESLRPRLVTFRDEKKRELFDLPDAPRPDEATPAPVRFLPEYDNVLLSHADRTRIVSDEDRVKVVTTNLMVVGSFLVDGFGAGTWKADDRKKVVTLTVSPFRTLPKRTLSDVLREGEAMLRFYHPGANKLEIRVAR